MGSQQDYTNDRDVVRASRPLLIHQIIATIVFGVVSVILRIVSDVTASSGTVITEEELKYDCLSAVLRSLHVSFGVCAGIMLFGLMIALLWRTHPEFTTTPKTNMGILIFLYAFVIAVSAGPVFKTVSVMTSKPEITVVTVSDKYENLNLKRNRGRFGYNIVTDSGEELRLPLLAYNDITPGAPVYLVSYNGLIIKAYDGSIYTIQCD